MSSHPQVVIIGAGFGGLEAARKLAQVPVDVTGLIATITTCSSRFCIR